MPNNYIEIKKNSKNLILESKSLELYELRLNMERFVFYIRTISNYVFYISLGI
ncbi:hypothetical protein MARI151_10648 [Maribacter litoralis]|uniref:Uncharacterized protein n=1 Tax=Maribacter litoralis TaxID=2059726 RepID=A0A653NBE9_9FLAO|nr:hypothetical protein MARI151_10648 [Maribacter litoralis]